MSGPIHEPFSSRRGITASTSTSSAELAASRSRTGSTQKGRTDREAKVTNARGGFSNHNFGIAFDVGVFSGSRYLAESPLYKAVGALGMELGLEWGGNWKTIVDQPHFQLCPEWAADMPERTMLAELRKRAELGQDIA